MMTWMTRASFLDTAADFDLDMLAQQQYEARQLLAHLVYENADEEVDDRHPVLRMWLGYELSLAAYAQSMTLTMSSQGLAFGTQGHTISATARELWEDDEEFKLPPWLEDTDVLRSHRSNLVRRYPDRFGSSWAKVPGAWPYLWPFVDDEGGYTLMLSKADKDLLANGERNLPKSILSKIGNA